MFLFPLAQKGYEAPRLQCDHPLVARPHFSYEAHRATSSESLGFAAKSKRVPRVFDPFFGKSGAFIERSLSSSQ